MTRILLLLFALLAWGGGLPARAGDRVRFTFASTTEGPSADRKAFVTLLARDAAGRFVRLDAAGRLLPCLASDNRVEWGGRLWCDYGIPVAGRVSLDLDRSVPLSGGRAYLSLDAPVRLRVDEATGGLVEPAPGNPEDPNRGLVYDWIEFALDPLGFHGNTTCVDQFGMPVTLSVKDRRNPGHPIGPVGLAGKRSEIFRHWRATVPEPFRGLESPDGNRILAPGHDARTAGGCAQVFDAFLGEWWERFRTQPFRIDLNGSAFTGRVDPRGRMVLARDAGGEGAVIAARPSASEMLRCEGVLAQGSPLERVMGAQIAALLHRHVEDPQAWREASGYYRKAPCNEYARFWHARGLKGLAYAFAYDDVNDQSPSLLCAEPQEILVGFRWD